MSEEGYDNTFFTKHLFRSGCVCPTKLFYKSDRTTYPEQDFLLAHLKYNKKQMKKLLRTAFPGGIQVTRDGHRTAALQTADYLEQKEVTLFDASIIYDGCLAKVAILQKRGSRLNIFQIQTKAFDPTRQMLTDSEGRIRSKWKAYLQDFSYQLYLIEKKYPDWELEPSLVVPRKKGVSSISGLDYLLENGEKVPPGEVDNLLVFLPVKRLVERFWEGEESLFDAEEKHPLQALSYGEAMQKMREWYVTGERVFTGVGKKCINCEYRVPEDSLKPTQESGFRECWKQIVGRRVDEPHIFELIGPGTRTLLSDGIYLQKDVPLKEGISLQNIAGLDGRITDFSRRMLQLAKNRNAEIPDELVKRELFSELERCEYPLHFLDFEAGSYAVPVQSQRKPYHLVVFQYSCHTLYQNGSMAHHQWIHSGSDGIPNYQLVRSLREVPQISTGTIVQYSGFERAALKQIVEEIRDEGQGSPDGEEELIQWIRRIIRRNDTNTAGGPYMSDLSRMVRNYYFNRGMGDSLSIKEVVQSVMEVSPLLRERFSVPYTSKNLGEVIWWQQKNGEVRNPYEILRERQLLPVGKGTEAMAAYGELRTGKHSDSEEEQIRTSLLGYCELDTLAMVMIFLHWRELLEVQ